MTVDSNRNIAALKTSLFEAGAQLWRAFTWLMVICATLLLVSLGISSDKELQIPLIALSLSKYDAAAALLLMYSFAYLRYVVIANHQRYLFWDLAEKGGYYASKSYPWEALHPNAVNAIGYYAYVKGAALELDNLRFITLLNSFFGLVPLCGIVYLTAAAFGKWFPTTCLFLSGLVYAYAVAHLRKHIVRDQIQRKKVQGNKEQTVAG